MCNSRLIFGEDGNLVPVAASLQYSASSFVPPVEQNAVSLEFNLRLIPVSPVYVRGQILVSVDVQTVLLTSRGAGCM